jgi:hypothetical protein
MAKYNENGGIIGPATVPTGNFGSAPGVWKLAEVEKYIKEGIWPVATTGFQVANSLRFDDGSSDNLTRTPSVTGSQTTHTFSAWIKRASLSNYRFLSAYFGNLARYTTYYFENDSLSAFSGNYTTGGSSTTSFHKISNAVFRDVSAWYHIVIAVDTTQATASDRVKIYVNNEQLTSFSTDTNPSLNDTNYFNVTTTTMEIGSYNNTNYFDGYMAECVLIDGQQLTPSSFGETNSTTGNWIPKDVSGLTFGTNGFHLPFQNASALGQDDSGNGNNFTVNNLTSIDQCVDTCTNNFATWNPLNTYPANKPVLSQGNLQVVTVNADPGYWGASSTLGVSQGKWYWEVKPTNSTSGSPFLLGVSHQPEEMARNGATGASQYTASDWGYYGASGNIYNNSTNSSYGNTYTTNDIIGVALDLDNSKLYFSKNGIFQNSGDPTSGSTGTGALSITSGETYFAFVSDLGGAVCTYQANFGNAPFTVSSGNTDFSGLGNFEYEVPSGYRALCTKNIGLVG